MSIAEKSIANWETHHRERVERRIHALVTSAVSEIEPVPKSLFVMTHDYELDTLFFTAVDVHTSILKPAPVVTFAVIFQNTEQNIPMIIESNCSAGYVMVVSDQYVTTKMFNGPDKLTKVKDNHYFMHHGRTFVEVYAATG